MDRLHCCRRRARPVQGCAWLAAGKALAQALRIPMIGISSLDLLAFPHRHTDRVVVPVIDARKGEVFWAMYRQVPGPCNRSVARLGRSMIWC
jgi:tRNA A37 threonylcarbamoyladenosine modification protein TsaB